MDALTLLREARAAGLTVVADGDRLVVRGPRRADTIARRLLDRKDEILAVLAGPGCVQCGAPLPTPGRLWLDVRALRDAWRRVVWELGETAGWPELPLAAPRSVAPGELAWRRFISRASVADLQHVVAALHELLAEVPRPPRGPDG